MATSRPTLDAGPPLPQNLQPKPQQPNAAQLAGVQQDAQGSGASLQSAIVQKLIFAEQALSDVISMAPSMAPLQGVIDQMRKVAGSGLAQVGQPQPQPSGGLMGPRLMMGGSGA